MSTFAEFKECSEFLKLHSQRNAILSYLDKHKRGLESLSKQKLSLWSFNKLEKVIEKESDDLDSIE